MADDIALREPPIAIIFWHLNRSSICFVTCSKNFGNLFKFFLSKKSSFNLTVPMSSESVSIILPLLILASSVDPPPISIVTHSSMLWSKFLAAIAPKVASSLPSMTFKFMPSFFLKREIRTFAFGASLSAEVPTHKILLHL